MTKCKMPNLWAERSEKRKAKKDLRHPSPPSNTLPKSKETATMMEIFLPTNGVMVRRPFAFQRQSSCSAASCASNKPLLHHHHLHTTAPLSILYCWLSVAVTITLTPPLNLTYAAYRLCKCPPWCVRVVNPPLYDMPQLPRAKMVRWRRMWAAPWSLSREIWSSVIMAEKFLEQPWCWKQLLNY